jgi:hypothetical protein
VERLDEDVEIDLVPQAAVLSKFEGARATSGAVAQYTLYRARPDSVRGRPGQPYVGKRPPSRACKRRYGARRVLDERSSSDGRHMWA